ncbi:MAG: hypothetical protein ACYC1P_10780 [Gaiellaceae bacterium]
MPDLAQHRSMLTILISACSTARAAFEPADSGIDRELLADLTSVIDRAQALLEGLTAPQGVQSEPR